MQRLMRTTFLVTWQFAASHGSVVFPPDFLFGVATAPAQAEDALKDQWLNFALAGHVHAWSNESHPEDRLAFWSHPEIEIDLAVKLNVQVFRMGVDWTRLYPAPGQFNATAMSRYVEIVRKVQDAGLKVMMTLFHHSIPAWANDFGGWTSDAILPHFKEFSTKAIEHLGGMVDFWNTFNEPHVFVGFTYCSGMWPPGFDESISKELLCMLPNGDFNKAMGYMAEAHNAFAKQCRKARVRGLIGFAHNIAHYVPHKQWDMPAVLMLEHQTKFAFVDAVQDNMDFVGLNYYGREIISGSAPMVSADFEYSESGRCVDPNGLYLLLKQFWERYSSKAKGIFITENGISDATDIIRPSYIVEHLLAVDQAMQEGVRVMGYVHWTTSDNWEWVDGYCPKFGLAAVNRSAPGMPRIPRPSFGLYGDIALNHEVTEKQRTESWQLKTDAVAHHATRPFCRAADGKTSLDKPVQRKISARDWRFKLPQESPALIV